jgi:hypothetical protein
MEDRVKFMRKVVTYSEKKMLWAENFPFAPTYNKFEALSSIR